MSSSLVALGQKLTPKAPQLGRQLARRFVSMRPITPLFHVTVRPVNVQMSRPPRQRASSVPEVQPVDSVARMLPLLRNSYVEEEARAKHPPLPLAKDKRPIVEPPEDDEQEEGVLARLWGQFSRAFSEPLRLIERNNRLLELKAKEPHPPIYVTAPEMFNSLDELNDGKTYAIGFATKEGIPVPYIHFPIRHSGLCYYDEETGKHLILGRQSPYTIGRAWKIGLHTIVGNEKDFLHTGLKFKVRLTEARFTKQEIKTIIEASDKLNGRQLCDLYYSNCYSSSAAGLSFALQIVSKRAQPNPQALDEIVDLLSSKVLVDHYSIGVGNNERVREILRSSLTMAAEAARTHAETDPRFETVLSKIEATQEAFFLPPVIKACM